MKKNPARAINPVIEARRRKLMDARTVAIQQRDFAAMNEITKRLAKLPVKGDKGDMRLQRAALIGGVR